MLLAGKRLASRCRNVSSDFCSNITPDITKRLTNARLLPVGGGEESKGASMRLSFPDGNSRSRGRNCKSRTHYKTGTDAKDARFGGARCQTR
jgi:hypothetical protein